MCMAIERVPALSGSDDYRAFSSGVLTPFVVFCGLPQGTTRGSLIHVEARHNVQYDALSGTRNAGRHAPNQT